MQISVLCKKVFVRPHARDAESQLFELFAHL